MNLQSHRITVRAFRCLYVITLLATMVASGQVSENYDLRWFVLSNGGNARLSAQQKLDDALGQNAAGLAVSATNRLEIGFIAGAHLTSGGLEADVAPRPDGDGVLLVNDWVQSGRFVAGLDDANNGSEFQRADSAPHATAGDGALLVNDWVQAGRYVAGLDPIQLQAGPTNPSKGQGTLTPLQKSTALASEFLISEVPVQVNTLRRVAVFLDAQGVESAVGFSIAFDATRLRYVSATPGPDVPPDAVLLLNTTSADTGRLGVLLGLNLFTEVPETFVPGRRELLWITFEDATAEGGDIAVQFTNEPVAMGISDAHANLVPFTVMPEAAHLLRRETGNVPDTAGEQDASSVDENSPVEVTLVDESADISNTPQENAEATGCCARWRDEAPLNKRIRRFFGDYLLFGLSILVVLALSLNARRP